MDTLGVDPISDTQVSSLVGRTAIDRDFLLSFMENMPPNRLTELTGGMGTGITVTPETKSDAPRVNKGCPVLESVEYLRLPDTTDPVSGALVTCLTVGL